jgi:PST family polysaccharide transporter
MRFPALAVIEVTSLAAGFISGCVLAWAGIGYWALVAQQVITAACGLVMTWLVSRWRPHMPSLNSGVRPMVTFGAHLSLADLIVMFSTGMDSILIGRFFGAVPLGLYTRAQVLLARPIQQVITPTNAVLIPVLSRLQSDPQRYRYSYMQAYGGLALIVFSFSAMCFALAKPLVLVILGSKWTGVIPMFAGFALLAVSWPLGEICAWIYESQGRGRDQLRNHTAAGVVTIVSYVIGLRWGPLGVVSVAAIMSLFVRLPIVYFIAGRSGAVRTRDLWMGFLSYLPCWGTVFLATATTERLLLNAPPIVQLIVCVPIGLSVGTALMLLFPRPRQSAFFAGGKIKSALRARFAAA